jgi:hypothetical protein
MASGTTRRSSLSRIRSAAQIATSVPAPTAMPRSAAASAGPSFTPSPTMAIRCPRACKSLMMAALAAGRIPAITSSTPTAAATARAVSSLSPVSRTGRRPRRRSPATAPGADGLTVSATASAPLTSPSQQTRTVVWPARSHCVHWLARSGGIGTPRSRSSLCRPTTISRPSTSPRAPRPGRARKPSAWGSGPSSAKAAALIAAAMACSDACSTAPAYLSRSARLMPGTARSPVSVIWPLVTVPVLSSTTVSIDPDDSRA